VNRRPFAVARLDDLERVDGMGPTWRPVRRVLDVTGLGINAYTADEAGGEVIEPHDETSPGAARHEEVYVVATGRATFTVAGESIDAPAGTLVRVDVGVHRHAVAKEPGTTVIVVSGAPGAALPSAPYEHWYAAQPAYERGDYSEAIAIASEGLRDHPDQLACFRALSGDREQALADLRIAFAGDPRTRAWAKDDEDLESLRGDPGWPG
jgi:mannose-6-phosphate isomerase-like protein (cupin superfamily)